METRPKTNDFPTITEQPGSTGPWRELSMVPSSREGSPKPPEKEGTRRIVSGKVQSERGSTGRTLERAVLETPITTQPTYHSQDTRGTRGSAARRSSVFSHGSSSSGSSMADNPMLSDELSGLGGYDVIRIVQQMERDLIAGCGSGNTYQIVSKSGGKLFSAVEDSSCFCRWMCGPQRMSHVTIYDLNDRVVLHLDRNCCRCDCCCCCNCFLGQNILTVRDARGNVLGRIQQKCHIFQLKMHILDPEDNVIMQVFGPCCPCRCCAEINFDIMNHLGTKELGYILKRWEAEDVVDFSEINTDHENIEITMPRHGSLEDRALIIGATFLVNFMYMEMS